MAKLKPTASNILGPYYREGAPFRESLTKWSEGDTALWVSGRVMDTDGNPVSGAVIDVWHADTNGDYDNDSPEYDCRGKLITNEEGEYFYETIIPGRYDNGTRRGPGGMIETVYRPEHIHYIVTANGFSSLTTQMYFEGDPWNDVDPFIEESLITKFEPIVTPIENPPMETKFDIVLEKRQGVRKL